MFRCSWKPSLTHHIAELLHSQIVHVRRSTNSAFETLLHAFARLFGNLSKVEPVLLGDIEVLVQSVDNRVV